MFAAVGRHEWQESHVDLKPAVNSTTSPSVSIRLSKFVVAKRVLVWLFTQVRCNTTRISNSRLPSVILTDLNTHSKLRFDILHHCRRFQPHWGNSSRLDTVIASCGSPGRGHVAGYRSSIDSRLSPQPLHGLYESSASRSFPLDISPPPARYSRKIVFINTSVQKGIDLRTNAGMLSRIREFQSRIACLFSTRKVVQSNFISL